MRDFLHRLLASVLLLALPVGAAAEAPLSVYTVNYPLAYFADRIGGTEVRVTFPAPRDVDPAFWNPDAATVQRYQNADLILLNGAGYAHWLVRASLPRRKLVDTSHAFRDRLIEVGNATTHSHGPGGAHAHTGTAFVTWLDPTQAIAQAGAIERAFAQARPGNVKQFEAALNRLVAELEALDRDLDAALRPIARQPLLASHPVYQYLARRYGLNLRSVTWEPDILPNESDWRALGEMIGSHPAKWMLWERPPRQDTASRLEAMGVGSIVFDPCPNVPVSGDFLSMMKRNIANVEASASR